MLYASQKGGSGFCLCQYLLQRVLHDNNIPADKNLLCDWAGKEFQ